MTGGDSPCILPYMDTLKATPAEIPEMPAESNSTKNRIFDGHFRKPEKKTVTMTLRVFEDQADIMKEKYEGNSSVIVRLLLDRFLKGLEPEVEDKYKKMLQAKEQSQLLFNETL